MWNIVSFRCENQAGSIFYPYVSGKVSATCKYYIKREQQTIAKTDAVNKEESVKANNF